MKSIFYSSLLLSISISATFGRPVYPSSNFDSDSTIKNKITLDFGTLINISSKNPCYPFNEQYKTGISKCNMDYYNNAFGFLTRPVPLLTLNFIASQKYFYSFFIGGMNSTRRDQWGATGKQYGHLKEGVLSLDYSRYFLAKRFKHKKTEPYYGGAIYISRKNIFYNNFDQDLGYYDTTNYHDLSTLVLLQFKAGVVQKLSSKINLRFGITTNLIGLSNGNYKYYYNRFYIYNPMPPYNITANDSGNYGKVLFVKEIIRQNYFLQNVFILLEINL